MFLAVFGKDHVRWSHRCDPTWSKLLISGERPPWTCRKLNVCHAGFSDGQVWQLQSPQFVYHLNTHVLDAPDNSPTDLHWGLKSSNLAICLLSFTVLLYLLGSSCMKDTMHAHNLLIDDGLSRGSKALHHCCFYRD